MRIDMTSFWDLNNHEQWHKQLEHYWHFLKPGPQIKLEHEINILETDMIKKMSPEEFFAFLHDKYFAWKYTAPNRLATTRNQLKRYITEFKMDELSAVQKELFDFSHVDIKRGLQIAQKIKGLGPSGASGLLAVLFPEDFGTVDQFVVKALRDIPTLPEHNRIQKIVPKNISISDGVLLVQILRRKAVELNEASGNNDWTPRKIDMVLWAINRWK